MASFAKGLLLANMVGALTMLACGDEDDAASICSECDVQTPAAIQACQEFYNRCLTEGAVRPEDCAVPARQQCEA
jgi:hypothetical protein